MSVACGVGTGGLIFQRRDDAQDAFAICALVEAKTIGAVQLSEGPTARVTGVTSFGRLVHDVIDLGGIARVTNPAFLVEDAYLDHAGLIGHGADGVIETLAIIAQHVVGGAAADDI